MLDQLTEARDVAQDKLAQAEIALLQAIAVAEVLREDVRKLSAAVAALKGEAVQPTDSAEPLEVATSGEPPAQKNIHEMSPEEFDKERLRKQRAKEKEQMADNPYANVSCGGCGALGSLFDTMHNTAGGPIRMTVCGKCNNQMMR